MSEHINDDEIWDEFWQAGQCGGGIVHECKHDTVAFHDDPRAGTWEEGELEKLQAQAKTDPKKYMALDRDAYTTNFCGHEWMWECQECRREALGMMNRIWAFRATIAKFINRRVETEAKRAVEELQTCTLREHLNPDAPGWQPMGTAPKNATEVTLKMNTGAIYPRAHWAQNLSGEEQPAFAGWFVQINSLVRLRLSFRACNGDPVGWRPIGETKPATVTS